MAADFQFDSEWRYLGARRNRFAEFAFRRCDRKLSRFRAHRFFAASQFGFASCHSFACVVRCCDSKSFYDRRRRCVTRATDSSYWFARSAAHVDSQSRLERHCKLLHRHRNLRGNNSIKEISHTNCASRILHRERGGNNIHPQSKIGGKMTRVIRKRQL